MTLALRYAARSDVGPAPRGQRGLRRTPGRACSPSPTAWAATRPARSPVAVAVGALATLDEDSPGGDLLDRLSTRGPQRQRATCATWSTATRSSTAWAPRSPPCSGPARGSAWSTSATRAPTCCATASCSRSPTTTRSCRRLVDEGRITRGGGRPPPAALADHPRARRPRGRRARPVGARGPRRRPLPALQRRPVRRRQRGRPCATRSRAEASTEDAVERLVELALRGGGPDNITAIVADVVEVETRPPSGGAGAVGAAAAAAAGHSTHRHATPRPAKAAALRRRAGGRRRRVRRRRASRPARRRGPARARCWLLLGSCCSAARRSAAWRWSQTQYYVGADGEQVAIFRGAHPGASAGCALSDALPQPRTSRSTDLPTVPAGAGARRHRRRQPDRRPADRRQRCTTRRAVPSSTASPAPTPPPSPSPAGATPASAGAAATPSPPDPSPTRRPPDGTGPRSDCGAAVTPAAAGRRSRRGTELVLLVFAVGDRDGRLRVRRPRATTARCRPAMLGYGAGLGPAVRSSRTSPCAGSRRTPTRCCCPRVALLNGLGLVMIHRLDLADADRAEQLGRAMPGADAPPQLIWTAVGVALFVAVLLVVRDHRVAAALHLHRDARRPRPAAAAGCCPASARDQRRPDLDPARPASRSSRASSPRSC